MILSDNPTALQSLNSTNPVPISLSAWQHAEQRSLDGAWGNRKEKEKEKDPQIMGQMPALEAKCRILLKYPAEKECFYSVLSKKPPSLLIFE